jgi:hypothetical protein
MFKALSRSIVLCSALLSPAVLAAAANSVPFQRPLAFEPNRGQAPSEVSWTARGPGYQLYLTSTGASIVLAEPLPQSTPAAPFSPTSRPLAPKKHLPNARIRVVGMNLSGSHGWTHVRGLEPTGGVSNYLAGNDAKNWHSGIPQYARLQVNGVYDGIDLVFYGRGSNLEYDFVLAPGADPNQIRLAFDGAGPMRIDSKTGDLVIPTTTGSEMRHLRPRVYQQIGQQKVEVAGGYQILDNGQAAFRLAPYDRRSPLIVDPTVQFVVFLEGNAQDVTTGLAVDAAGNSYVLGETFSTDFPVKGGIQRVPKHCGATCPPNIFVTEISPAGQILNSTFIGGSDIDVPAGIAVDATGVWVTGVTDSRDFSTRPEFGFGFFNAFVAKLSGDLRFLDWCVTVGGGGDSQVLNIANAIAVDAKHAAYITGETSSSEFPTSNYLALNIHPKQKALAGASDAFVVKIDPDGFLNEGYSTYLGGSDTDAGNGIAVDSSGSAYVTGITFSKDFPTNAAPSHGSLANGGLVAFVTKLSPDGSNSIYSVLLGGTMTAVGPGPLDQGNSIVVTPSNGVYIVGTTCSSDFPTFYYSFQQSPPTPCLAKGSNQINTNAFVAELSSLGTLYSSTYLGGVNGVVDGNSVSVNRTGDVYVAGDTSTGSFPGAPTPPITPNPSAGFVTKFDLFLHSLKSTTFLGATVSDVVVTQPAARNPILAPFTPTTIYTAGGRFHPDTQNYDAFVVKLVDPVGISTTALEERTSSR